MRLALVLPLALLVASCGSSTLAPPDHRPVLAKHGPPAAWIQTRAGAYWLGFSTSCWHHGRTGVCADAGAPACGQASVPDVAVESGETVRAHLGYEAEEASVAGAETRLRGRVVSWHVKQAGPFLLFTRGRNGDASYVGCAVIR